MAKLRFVPAILALVLVIVLASFSASGPIVHAAAPPADQQCSSIGGSYLDGVGAHQPAGQTFTPTQSSMVGLSLHLWSSNPTDTSMTANIISNGIGGVNGIQGNVVGSVTFTVPAGFGAPTGDWLNVQVPSGFVLTPGAVYAINLIDNSGSGGIKWSACSSPYTNGCGYAGGQCQANSWAFIEYYGDYSVAFSTSGISIAQGASGTANLYVQSMNNFASPVDLTFSAPAGVTLSFNGPSRVQTSAGSASSPTVTIYVAGTVSPGTYPITVTASSGGISHTATIQLNVTPTGTVLSSNTPDFVSQPSPAVITLTPGVSKSSTVVVSSVAGFSSSVSLAASWLGAAPSDVTVSLPSPVTVPAGGTASSVLTLTAGSNPSTGDYTLLVTATNGVISHSTQVAVTIAGTPSVLAPVVYPDFAVASSSNTVSAVPGMNAGTSVIVSSIGGFSSPVTFSTSWVGSAPTGIAVSVPQSVTPPSGGAASSAVQFTTTATGSTGTYVLQVTGTSGSLSHSTDITLQVGSSGPQCIIATATYGSNVAPQVQLLRNFRDNEILSTRAGSSFMLAFNAWYYSFSPPVANYIASHSVARLVMQGVLYPAIEVLGISQSTFKAASAFPELAIVLSGLVASAMLGALYLGLPIGLVRAKVKRLRAARTGRSLERILAGAVIVSVSALAAAELTGSVTGLMISASALVLSTLLMSATGMSNRIARLMPR